MSPPGGQSAARWTRRWVKTPAAFGKTSFGEAPLGFAAPAEEPTIEYDDEALRHFERKL